MSCNPLFPLPPLGVRLLSTPLLQSCAVTTLCTVLAIDGSEADGAEFAKLTS